MTFTSKDEPAEATKVGGVDGQTFPVVRVDGAIHTVVGPVAALAFGVVPAKAKMERTRRIGMARIFFFKNLSPRVLRMRLCDFPIRIFQKVIA